MCHYYRAGDFCLLNVSLSDLESVFRGLIFVVCPEHVIT